MLQKYMAQQKAKQWANSENGDSPSKDFLYVNKQLIAQWCQFKEARKYHAQDEIMVKMLMAQQKKSQMEEERRKRNLFQLHKWDIVR